MSPRALKGEFADASAGNAAMKPFKPAVKVIEEGVESLEKQFSARQVAALQAQARAVAERIAQRDLSEAVDSRGQGIAQVAQIITGLDSMTQQNAALVEQSAAAATSLQGQADELARAVAVFRA